MGYASFQYYDVVAKWLRKTENYTTISTDYLGKEKTAKIF
jgi:hypothetical protein